MNKKERRLALATALQSAAASTVTVRDLKVPMSSWMAKLRPAMNASSCGGCKCGVTWAWDACQMHMFSTAAGFRSLSDLGVLTAVAVLHFAEPVHIRP